MFHVTIDEAHGYLEDLRDQKKPNFKSEEFKMCLN
jgi:hypothetical protein